MDFERLATFLFRAKRDVQNNRRGKGKEKRK